MDDKMLSAFVERIEYEANHFHASQEYKRTALLSPSTGGGGSQIEVR